MYVTPDMKRNDDGTAVAMTMTMMTVEGVPGILSPKWLLENFQVATIEMLPSNFHRLF